VDAALDGHRRYLRALHEACVHSADVHRHQLSVLEREISLAADAADSSAYLAASGELFELTRAPTLDRLRNLACIAVAVGDPSRAEAAAAAYSRSLDATGHADWPSVAAHGATAAAALLAGGANARGAYTVLLHALIRIHSTSDDAELADAREQAGTLRAVLLEADPAFTPNRPAYANRTPWAGRGRGLLQGWLNEPGRDREPQEPADVLARIEAGSGRWRAGLSRAPAGGSSSADPGDVVAPYRAALDVPELRDAAEALIAAAATAPTPQHALARFVGDGLLTAFAAAPLRARAADGLARQEVWADPLVEHHWRALLAALDQAVTPTEVELLASHADACLEVEADWNSLLLGSLFLPVRASCRVDARPADLELAADLAYRLHGLSARELLELPRVARFVDRLPTILSRDSLGDAFKGEAGFDVVVEARRWLEATGSPPHPRATLRNLPLRAVEPQPVALWGETFELADLDAVLVAPPRPPIPGLAVL
jgi:hypothetical protein